MLTSKIFNTISAYICSCSCQYCHHIRQVRGSISFSFHLKRSVTLKSAEKVFAAGAHDTPPDSLIGWGGTPPIPTPTTHSASRYRRLRRLSVNPSDIFSAYGPKETCLRNGVQFVDGDVKFYSLTPRLTAVGSEGLPLSPLGDHRTWRQPL